MIDEECNTYNKPFLVNILKVAHLLNNIFMITLKLFCNSFWSMG